MTAEIANRLPHYPVPAVVIGRLAVDLRGQGTGLGEILLLDTIRRVVRAGDTIGVHAVVVDALHDRAGAFYERYGFVPFPSRPLQLHLSIRTFEQLGLQHRKILPSRPARSRQLRNCCLMEIFRQCPRPTRRRLRYGVPRSARAIWHRSSRASRCEAAPIRVSGPAAVVGAGAAKAPRVPPITPADTAERRSRRSARAFVPRRAMPASATAGPC